MRKLETNLPRWLHDQTSWAVGCVAALGGGRSLSLADLVFGGLEARPGAWLRMSRRRPLHRSQAGRAGQAGRPSRMRTQRFVEVGCGKGGGLVSAGCSAKHSPGRAG